MLKSGQLLYQVFLAYPDNEWTLHEAGLGGGHCFGSLIFNIENQNVDKLVNSFEKTINPTWNLMAPGNWQNVYQQAQYNTTIWIYTTLRTNKKWSNNNSN